MKGPLICLMLVFAMAPAVFAAERLRVMIETDAGGDPDDEQTLVRFLLYANQWDVEGIIANRPKARDGENHNPKRTGLEIVRRHLDAYAQVYEKLRVHDARFPTADALRKVTVAGYDDVQLKDVINTVLGDGKYSQRKRDIVFQTLWREQSLLNASLTVLNKAGTLTSTIEAAMACEAGFSGRHA